MSREHAVCPVHQVRTRQRGPLLAISQGQTPDKGGFEQRDLAYAQGGTSVLPPISLELIASPQNCPMAGFFLLILRPKMRYARDEEGYSCSGRHAVSGRYLYSAHRCSM